MPDRDELDKLIHSALGTYADPGEDSDLAQCVLARIAAEGTQSRRRRWLPWAIALPAAAALLIFIMLSGSGPRHSPGNASQAPTLQPPSNTTAAAEPSTNPRSTPAQRLRTSPSRPRPLRVVIVSKAAPLPKLDVFPTPQPLTPQEQALVAYVAHASASERQALLDAQSQMDQPLSIAAIKIQPLEPPEPGGN